MGKKSHQKRNRNNQCLIPENVRHLEWQNAAIIRILSIQVFGTNAIDIGSIGLFVNRGSPKDVATLTTVAEQVSYWVSCTRG